MGQSPSRRTRDEPSSPVSVAQSDREPTPATEPSPTTREAATQTKDPAPTPRPQRERPRSTIRNSFLGLVHKRRATEGINPDDADNSEAADSASSGPSRIRRISRRLSRFIVPDVPVTDPPDDVHEVDAEVDAHEDEYIDPDEELEQDEDAHELDIQHERPPTPMPLPITAPAPPTPPPQAPAQAGATPGRTLPSAGPLVIVQGVVHTNDPTAPLANPSSTPDPPPPATPVAGTSPISGTGSTPDAGISNNSMDVLGTLLTVAAQATAASLLTGSTEALLGRPSYPPTAFPSAANAPPPRRTPWAPFRDRLASAAPSSPPHHSSPFSSAAPAADPHPHPHPHPNFHEDRAAMVADMARAFHLGLGMGLPGSGAANSPRASSEGNTEENSDGNSSRESAPAPAEGSFDRFLVDLQSDLRIVLNGGTPPVRAGADETLTRARPAGEPEAEEEEDDEEEDDDDEEDSIDDDDDEDDDSEVEGETTAATTPAMTPGELVSGSPSEPENSTAASSPPPTTEPAAAPNTRPAPPPGTVNWWRLYRFPPIAAAGSSSTPSTSSSGAATASSTTTPEPDSTAASTSTLPPPTSTPITPPQPQPSQQPQTVVPVIVIGLQSIRGPLGNLFAGAFAPPPGVPMGAGPGMGRTPVRTAAGGGVWNTDAPAPSAGSSTQGPERPDWEEVPGRVAAEYALERAMDRVRERDEARRREAEEREPLVGTNGERRREDGTVSGESSRRHSWWRLGRGRRGPQGSASASSQEHSDDYSVDTDEEDEEEEPTSLSSIQRNADVPDPDVEAARAEARALALALAGALPGLTPTSGEPPSAPPPENAANGEEAPPLAPVPTTEDSSRTFFIYVIGGYYPPDHGLVTGTGGIEALEALMDFDLLNYARPPRATKADIERSGLAIVKRDALPGRVLENCLEQCLICLDEYTKEDAIRVLSCKHAFHQTCIDRWLETGRNNCPACRTAGVPTDSRAPPPVM